MLIVSHILCFCLNLRGYFTVHNTCFILYRNLCLNTCSEQPQNSTGPESDQEWPVETLSRSTSCKMVYCSISTNIITNGLKLFLWIKYYSIFSYTYSKRGNKSSHSTPTANTIVIEVCPTCHPNQIIVVLWAFCLKHCRVEIVSQPNVQKTAVLRHDTVTEELKLN